MPSSKGYVRDYKQEDKTAKARGEQGVGSTSGNAERGRLRRLELKRGMVKKGQDVDHKVPLSKGGAPVSLKNARVESQHANRSFPRNPDGSMIANHAKTKEKKK